MSQSGLPTWQQDKNWSDKFLIDLKRICGEFLVGAAPYDEDAERNTDLVVLRLEPVRIACRVRKHKYASDYADEFTLRSGRPNGHKTELTKIVEGWGDYILYGFADAEEAGLCAWVLGDLRVFRLWFNRQIVQRKGELPGLEQPNYDGSSVFRAFKICELPEAFVIARKRLDVLVPF